MLLCSYQKLNIYNSHSIHYSTNKSTTFLFFLQNFVSNLHNCDCLNTDIFQYQANCKPSHPSPQLHFGRNHAGGKRRQLKLNLHNHLEDSPQYKAGGRREVPLTIYSFYINSLLFSRAQYL